MIGARGVTLIELLVVLVLLGIMAGVVGLAFRPGWESSDPGHTPIASLRRRAAELGRAVMDTVTLDGHAATILALPDGRIVGAAGRGVNPLTGEVNR